jgi:hypothetical protein
MSAPTTAAAVAAWSVAPGALDHRYGLRDASRARRMRPTVGTTARTTSLTASTGGPFIPPFTKRTDPPGPHPVG